MNTLNRECRCWPIERELFLQAMSAEVRAAVSTPQANLFADTGVFLAQDDLRVMQQQIEVIEALAGLPGFAEPGEVATQSTRGVLMGYDFHLSESGPRLIEINTNAGGAFVAQLMSATLGLNTPAGSAQELAAELGAMFTAEWQLAGRSGQPATIAIVDDDPAGQFLYSDMLLAAELLGQQFDRVVIVDPAEIESRPDATGMVRLWHADQQIDLVYNRLTDFMLSEPASRQLYTAWQADAIVLTPAPDHHQRLANKRNLVRLSDPQRLRELGATDRQVGKLTGIPRTLEVTPDNADELWLRRKLLFFKPAAGFGSRAAYRGAKLTRRVWQSILAGNYVAQELVQPPLRVLPDAPARMLLKETHLKEPQLKETLLKFDVRVFSYAGRALGLIARAYQGQTTNFRTAGGGFAPVVVLESDVSCSVGGPVGNLGAANAALC